MGWQAARVASGVCALGAAAALAVVGTIDPRGTRLSVCPLLEVTGLACPLCGSMTATYFLLHGRLAEALSSNAFTVLVVLPALALAACAWGVYLVRSDVAVAVWGHVRRPVQRTVSVLLIVGLVFGVYRNMAVGAHLNPYAGHQGLVFSNSSE